MCGITVFVKKKIATSLGRSLLSKNLLLLSEYPIHMHNRYTTTTIHYPVLME